MISFMFKDLKQNYLCEFQLFSILYLTNIQVLITILNSEYKDISSVICKYSNVKTLKIANCTQLT